MKRKPLPESQRVFTFVSASELLAAKQSVAVAVPVKVQSACPIVSPAATSPAPAAVDPAKVPDVCEFVRDPVFEGSCGRKCCDGTFCPSRIYGAAAIFVTCPTRVAKLKAKAKEQS